jgi:hypothetical protein
VDDSVVRVANVALEVLHNSPKAMPGRANYGDDDGGAIQYGVDLAHWNIAERVRVEVAGK